jgi:hypothetical protein
VRGKARARAYLKAPRVGQRVVVDDLSGRIATLRAGLTTRLQHRTDEPIIFDEIDRAKSAEPDATADVLYPSRREPVLAAERPDTVNSPEPILEFPVDRAAELDRVLGLLQDEPEETPNNIQPKIQPKSADSQGSDSACDRLTDRGARVESHLIALNDTRGGLLVLDGDGRVTMELQASKTMISVSERAKPYLLVTQEAAESAGLLNPFVDSGLGSDPLIRQHYLSAKFDLHAWIFEAMFGVSFVSQNQNTLRHFSKMLIGLPNASFRTWQDLISEECLPTLPSYARIAGAPETAEFFETVLCSHEFQLVTKQLQKSISSYLSDPLFEHLTTATSSGRSLQSFANNGYLIVFSAEGSSRTDRRVGR